MLCAGLVPVVTLAQQAGRSDNRAHFRFTPGAHGGTVTPLDEAATELIDPHFDRPLRPVAALGQLDFDEAQPAEGEDEPPAQPARTRRGERPVPPWEDVLLGGCSGGQR